MSKLLHAKDAAEILGLRISTVYQKAAEGVLPCVVLWRGRRKDCIRFSQEALQDFIRRQSVEPRSANGR